MVREKMLQRVFTQLFRCFADGTRIYRSRGSVLALF